MGSACALIVGKEEKLRVPDGSTKGSAKLVLFEGRPGGIKVTARIERGIAEELERFPVKDTAAGLGDDSYDSAILVSILGIEVVGENTELFNRIQVWNNRGTAVHVFLNIHPIHHESIGRLALPID